jgi:hypothetical protein
VTALEKFDEFVVSQYSIKWGQLFMNGSSYMVFGVVPHCRQAKEEQAK